MMSKRPPYFLPDLSFQHCLYQKCLKVCQFETSTSRCNNITRCNGIKGLFSAMSVIPWFYRKCVKVCRFDINTRSTTLYLLILGLCETSQLIICGVKLSDGEALLEALNICSPLICELLIESGAQLWVTEHWLNE